ncbi:hypothetical protein [Paracoccus onubensis]|uniref:hypothetical protein n=1 Tax=Paracoccus onubensis TaxID=1675788 RepID=UPI0015FF65E7|nr:hypothetical protein [Paracoccus onubensis]
MMARKPAQTKPAAEDKSNLAQTNSESTTAKDAAAATGTKPASGDTSSTATQSAAAEAKSDGTVAASTNITAADLKPAAGDTDNWGANTAGTTADAPAHAPATDDQGQTGGEERSVLPATSSDNEPQADLTVICHRKGGRRRAGLRWKEGKTNIVSADLSDYALAQLRGDPQFTVLPIEKD